MRVHDMTKPPTRRPRAAHEPNSPQTGMRLALRPPAATGSSRLRRATFLVAIAGLLFCLAARAKDTPPIPVEDFFRFPKYDAMRLSPSGRYIAALVPAQGRQSLAIIDVDSRKAVGGYGFNDIDIGDFRWINDKRLVFSVYGRDLEAGDQWHGGGLFAVDRDGSDFRELVPTIASQLLGKGVCVSCTIEYAQLLSREPQDSDEVLLVVREATVRRRRGREFFYGYVVQVNTRTGRRQSLPMKPPPRVYQWIADKQNQVRAAIGEDESGGRNYVYLRDDADSDWKLVHEMDAIDRDWFPIGFDFDGSLFVASDKGRNTAALYKYDRDRQNLGELVLADARIDLGFGALIFDRRAKKLLGAQFEADKPETLWFDRDWARLQAGLDKALPGRRNVLSKGTDSPWVLVGSYSDRAPTEYYLLDMKNLHLERGLSSRPWIKPDSMSEMRPYRYKARDGLEIPAYLLLPQHKSERKPPLVVLVHGGPWVRGYTWGWDAEAQFLSSRGYAVLLPNFRGSTGYGVRHFRAGWKQWGLAMQDDLADGVKQLVADGLVDKSRVCIMGASYGGYAALMGLVKDADVYRCAVDLYGVTDIKLLFTSALTDIDLRIPEQAKLGSLEADTAQFTTTSPALLAAKIKGPVLLAYGGQDQRVPLEHGEAMRNALRAENKKFEWIVYTNEGHGLTKEENRFDLYRRIEKFLRDSLAP